MSGHPRLRLNPHFTNPIRLSLMAALASVDEIDFQTLRDSLALSDSTLSKHASAMENEGYVHVRKGYVGKRPRTWLSCTAAGRKAFREHSAALRELTEAP